MFQETQEPKLACEVAKKLVQRHDLQLNMLEADGHFFIFFLCRGTVGKECVALLEVCVDRGRKAGVAALQQFSSGLCARVRHCRD